MTTLLKKDYGYSNVLWEDVIGRVKEIIRDEYNISPYISPELNTSINSPFRVWIDGQETNQFATSNWYKEYSISINQYFKVEKNVNFYKRVYQDAERLYEIFFHNMGSYDVTTTTYKVKFYNAKPESVDISQEGEYFRIELIYNLIVNRDDNEVYIISSPSTVRAKTRAIEKPYNFWSLDFDGSDDSVNCGSDSSLDDIFDGGGSVSVWFNSSAINATHTIVSKKGGGTGYWAIRISDNSGNTGRFYFIKSFDSSHYTTQQSTRDINANTWYHAVVVYNADSDSNRITAYLNGEVITNLSTTMDGTDTPTGTRISDANQDVLIGKCNQFEFLGNIADVAIFNSTLDATNVTAIYNSGKPIDLTCDAGNYNNANNLVGYWKMGDGYLDELPSDINGGVIIDQINPIIGDELFNGDEKGAALILSGGDPSGDDLNIEYSSGEWILTGQGGDTYGIIYLSDKTENGGCVSDLESNSMYKISLDMKELGDCLFKSVSGVSDVQQDYLTSDYVKYIHYVVTDSSTSDTDPYLLFTLIGSGEKVYIKNISVKKIEGNPGRTLQMNASSQSTDVPT